MNMATHGKILRDQGLRNVMVEDPYNPLRVADSFSVLERILEMASVEVDDIFVEGNRTRQGSYGIRNSSFKRYKLKKAMVILCKKGRRITTAAPWEQAMTLSYLMSKDVWLRIPQNHT
jgi:hypothetical protein